MKVVTYFNCLEKPVQAFHLQTAPSSHVCQAVRELSIWSRGLQGANPSPTPRCLHRFQKHALSVLPHHVLGTLVVVSCGLNLLAVAVRPRWHGTRATHRAGTFPPTSLPRCREGNLEGNAPCPHPGAAMGPAGAGGLSPTLTASSRPD